jgi:hypothetical protein
LGGRRMRRAQPVRGWTSHRGVRSDVQGLPVVLAAVRKRLVIRPQLLQQPHARHRPVGRLCQATTRTETVERAIKGELQQSRWGIGRPPRGCGWGALQAERGEVEGATKASRKRPGCSAGIASSSRSGNRSASWRLAPWLKPMQGQNSEKATPFLVVGSRARVYQNIAFSHSLALEATGHTTGFFRVRASVRCGPRLSLGVRPLTVQDTPEYCVGEMRFRYNVIPWQSSMTFARKLQAVSSSSPSTP